MHGNDSSITEVYSEVVSSACLHIHTLNTILLLLVCIFKHFQSYRIYKYIFDPNIFLCQILTEYTNTSEQL